MSLLFAEQRRTFLIKTPNASHHPIGYPTVVIRRKEIHIHIVCLARDHIQVSRLYWGYPIWTLVICVPVLFRASKSHCLYNFIFFKFYFFNFKFKYFKAIHRPNSHSYGKTISTSLLARRQHSKSNRIWCIHCPMFNATVPKSSIAFSKRNVSFAFTSNTLRYELKVLILYTALITFLLQSINKLWMSFWYSKIAKWNV